MKPCRPGIPSRKPLVTRYQESRSPGITVFEQVSYATSFRAKPRNLDLAFLINCAGQSSDDGSFSGSPQRYLFLTTDVHVSNRHHEQPGFLGSGSLRSK